MSKGGRTADTRLVGAVRRAVLGIVVSQPVALFAAGRASPCRCAWLPAESVPSRRALRCAVRSATFLEYKFYLILCNHLTSPEPEPRPEGIPIVDRLMHGT
ncbi:hypothetical protein,hypothetical protein [Burkholderia pseudomallei]|nr:hypothetical protein,hypothetical protein [Burkholderia pseudomallei]